MDDTTKVKLEDIDKAVDLLDSLDNSFYSLLNDKSYTLTDYVIETL